MIIAIIPSRVINRLSLPLARDPPAILLLKMEVGAGGFAEGREI